LVIIQFHSKMHGPYNIKYYRSVVLDLIWTQAPFALEKLLTPIILFVHVYKDKIARQEGRKGKHRY
jgi:hypothetical protein